jgi:hypothetical protein
MFDTMVRAKKKLSKNDFICRFLDYMEVLGAKEETSGRCNTYCICNDKEENKLILSYYSNHPCSSFDFIFSNERLSVYSYGYPILVIDENTITTKEYCFASRSFEENHSIFLKLLKK